MQSSQVQLLQQAHLHSHIVFSLTISEVHSDFKTKTDFFVSWFGPHSCLLILGFSMSLRQRTFRPLTLAPKVLTARDPG